MEMPLPWAGGANDCTPSEQQIISLPKSAALKICLVLRINLHGAAMNGRARKEDILLWSKLGALLANYKASESFLFQ